MINTFTTVVDTDNDTTAATSVKRDTSIHKQIITGTPASYFTDNLYALMLSWLIANSKSLFIDNTLRTSPRI